MKFTVRRAIAEDAADACSVIRTSIIECCEDDHRGEAKLLERWLSNKTPETLRKLILAPDMFSIVASIDETTVGFAAASGTGEVMLCYVAPSVRFTGAGKALVAAIEEHATSSGVRALRLESTLTARAFYLRNGFVLEGPSIQAFGMEAQPMQKELGASG